MGNKLLTIARWILGAVFIFSGFVKGIDPWGFDYKLTDYIHSMNLNWLEIFTFPGAFLLPIAEFLIGVGLLCGILTNLSIRLAFIFMSFFLPLTLYIAIKNPVTDCGCFGDALVITNWQTFFKNIVLIAIVILLFINRKKIFFLFPLKIRKLLFFILTLCYIILVYWSFNHDPIIDFRPYKVGVNIPDGMKTPKGAPTNVYKNTFYYRNLKSNKIKKFEDNNYPWQDSLNWKFVSVDQVIVKEGYTPPIHDFVIQTPEGENVTDFFLQDDNYLFIVVAYDLSKSSTKNQKTLNELSNWAKDQGYKFICLTSSTGSVLDNFKARGIPTYDFYFGDEITLKTIIRSNPGLLLLKKGTILAKWHYNDFPTVQKMQNQIISEMKKRLIYH
jgi:uncharacterized membrane protein YphA (DoxX/SURF4 family)